MDEPYQKKEVELWRSVCAQLKALGAVTEADLHRSRHHEPKTPGEELLNSIREWGVAYEQLMQLMRL